MNRIINWKTGEVIAEGDMPLRDLIIENKRNLQYADLRGIDMSGLDLRNSNMSHADMSYSIITGAIFGWDDITIPKVENIHTKIYEWVTNNPALFDMGSWHTKTECGTTHCRAGKAIDLAGEEGYALEKVTGSGLAGYLIYKNSSAIEVPIAKFYVENDEALKDIKRCAELEKK